MSGRPRLTDAAVVVFTAAAGLLSTIGSHRALPSLPEAVLLVLEAVPLWWRRSRPLLVLGIVLVVEAGKWLFGYANEPAGVALVFAVYAVSVYERPRVRLAVAAAAITLIVAAVLLLFLGHVPEARTLIPPGALSLVAWVVGDYQRSRRQLMLDVAERQKKIREQAAEEERLRIARELHDVVAHNVSVIAIQAGAARVSGTAGDEVLASIEQGARDTLSELNKLLGVLRKNPGAPELAPQPTLEDVETLLKPARDAGIDAALRVTGERRPLPAAVDLSAYRIVQEAVTNVLKHANASRLEVVVHYGPEALSVAVSDNGAGAPEKEAARTAGHGLIGMRERVQLFGGDLSTGSSSLGGFIVRATLPVKA